MEPIVKSLDEFLGERGLNAPMSDFMIDKIKVPHGLTQRKRKALEKEAAEAAKQYSEQRSAAIEEYNRLLSEGKVRAPSNIERLLKVAAGHEDNTATQAARRTLEKRGIDWRSELKDRKELEMEPIIKNDFFELTETGKDFDFIATIKNLTDQPLIISFDFINMDRYDDCLPDIEIAPCDYVGLLANDDGREQLSALKNGDFSLGSEPAVKATQIDDNFVQKSHCDWIIEQAKELKALLANNSDNMVALNRTRALSAIDTAMSSLRELKAYVEEISKGPAALAINNMDNLPAQCYAVHNTTGEVIILKRGETGYYHTPFAAHEPMESKKEFVDDYNQKLGVTKAQAAAMYAGSMFGFHVPAANPDMYDDNGKPRRSSLDSRISVAEEKKSTSEVKPPQLDREVENSK